MHLRLYLQCSHFQKLVIMWELLVIKLPNHLPCHKMADQKCIIFEQKVHFSTLNTKISNDMLFSAFLLLLLQQEYSNKIKLKYSRSKINSISM